VVVCSAMYFKDMTLVLIYLPTLVVVFERRSNNLIYIVLLSHLGVPSFFYVTTLVLQWSVTFPGGCNNSVVQPLSWIALPVKRCLEKGQVCALRNIP
jgi:hypothetical protein